MSISTNIGEVQQQAKTLVLPEPKTDKDPNFFGALNRTGATYFREETIKDYRQA
ncbi:hypothetical protein YC2023_010434 [Brassica napus]